ncbi:type I 3-dehydroquinate dehydratase [Salana multivorans]
MASRRPRPGMELASAPDRLPALRAECRLPVLATYRSGLEGGPGEIDDDAYGDLLTALVTAGADAIDVELTRGEEVVLAPVWLARENGVSVVGSSHDFTGTPDDLDVRFAEVARRGSDVLKIAVTPSSDTDVLRLLSSAVRARHEHGRSVLPVAMGPLGALTRVGGGLWRAPLTFARVGEGSAPGQLDVADAARVLAVLTGTGQGTGTDDAERPDAGDPR